MDVIHHDRRKKMKSIFSIMIDGSRDVSNKMELIIGVQYYDIPANKLRELFLILFNRIIHLTGWLNGMSHKLPIKCI